MEYTLIAFVYLLTKHVLLDFMFQPEFQWRNKGTYGHLGGIVHSGQHAVGTLGLALFVPVFFPWLLIVAAVEYLVHYHIDWAKSQINSRRGWDANKNPEFWFLTGFDQYLHMLTYVLIIFAVL